MLLWKGWIAIAGTALIAGGVAWILKLWVIVATDGRVAYTGAAATFFALGLGLLMVGSTGVGLRLAKNQETSMRVVLALASPLVLILAFLVFSAIGYALVALGRVLTGDAVPGYLLEEGGILISAVVGLLAGIWLVAGVTMRGVPAVRAVLRAAGKPSTNHAYGERTPRAQAAPTASSSVFRIVKSDARDAMRRPSIKSASLAGCSKPAPTLCLGL